ncbi:hypothetical protein V8E53_007890 [Lactarius tabidus]
MWQHELAAYNIQIQHEDAATFFRVIDEHPDTPWIHPELWETLQATDMWSIGNSQIVQLINLAMDPDNPAHTPPQESTVDDLGMILLRELNLLTTTLVTCSRQDVPLIICGESRHAKSKVCLQDHSHNDTIHLVQENKQFQPTDEAQAQLMAEAIAAFQYNNLWQ